MDTLRSFERAYDERDKRRSRGFASEYMRNFLEEEPSPGIATELELVRRFLPEVSLEEINHLADQWLGTANSVILVSGPEKVESPLPPEAELAAVFEAVSREEIAPYVDRVREFTIIDVKATGQRYSAYGRWAEAGLGALNIDYSYSKDVYDDRVAGFSADNNTITGRLDFEMVQDLRLSAGVTWLKIGEDLDVEKSILMFEGHYAFMDDWFVEAKYNVYNYDDYVLLDRYYTANVIWLNLGYNISLN